MAFVRRRVGSALSLKIRCKLVHACCMMRFRGWWRKAPLSWRVRKCRGGFMDYTYETDRVHYGFAVLVNARKGQQPRMKEGTADSG